MSKPNTEALERMAKLAIKEAGGVMATAKLLGVKHPSVSRWTRVPVHHVRALSKRTKIPGYILRPDVYDRAAS
jgi:DNA-binding transcriptional regulator YdaS (Cro superfamily)